MRAFILLIIEWIGVLAVIQVFSISPAIQLRRPVKFTQPRREGQLTLSLVVLAVLLVALLTQWQAIPLQKLISFAQMGFNAQLARPESYNLTVLLWQTAFLALLIAPFLWNVRTRKQPWLSVGLKRQMISGGLQVGFGLALITVFLRSKVDNLITGPYTLESLWLLVGSLLSCFVVEFGFRGHLQLRLMAWLGDRQGWLLSSALYALWSILPLLQLPIGTIALNLGYRLVMGLILGWAARKSGGILAGWMYSTLHNWLFWL